MYLPWDWVKISRMYNNMATHGTQRSADYTAITLLMRPINKTYSFSFAISCFVFSDNPEVPQTWQACGRRSPSQSAGSSRPDATEGLELQGRFECRDQWHRLWGCSQHIQCRIQWSRSWRKSIHWIGQGRCPKCESSVSYCLDLNSASWQLRVVFHSLLLECNNRY